MKLHGEGVVAKAHIDVRRICRQDNLKDRPSLRDVTCSILCIIITVVMLLYGLWPCNACLRQQDPGTNCFARSLNFISCCRFIQLV